MNITHETLDALLEKITCQRLTEQLKRALPDFPFDELELIHGRWHGVFHGAFHFVFPISMALDAQAALRRNKAANAWRAALSDETAAGVEAMCRRLLKGNPNNHFVREVYPALYEQLVQEGQHVA